VSFGVVDKNSSFTLAKNKVKLEYINEKQPLPLELIFGIELELKFKRRARFCYILINIRKFSQILLLTKSYT